MVIVSIYFRNFLAVVTIVLFSSAAFASKDGDTKNAGDPGLFPLVIGVPTGFQPEGVAIGKDNTAYVGSLLTGAIYQVDLKSGNGHLLVGSATQPAVGLTYDKRTDYLFVAGGPSGRITVYNTTSGETLAHYTVAEQVGFINDGIVTKHAVYFTDSFFPRLYRLPLGKKGQLLTTGKISIITLGGDFENIDGQFNANGIQVKNNRLYVINSYTGKLYQVDPETGNAINVNMGGVTLPNGDGIVFDEDKLYVVQNFLNQVSVVQLAEDGLTGVVTNVITDPNYRIPTTAAISRDTLYVINARFDIAPPPLFGNPPADPGIEYQLVGVRLED